MLGKTHGVRAPTGLAKVMESAVGRIGAQEPGPRVKRAPPPLPPERQRRRSAPLARGRLDQARLALRRAPDGMYTHRASYK